jgi:hypothetical protein
MSHWRDVLGGGSARYSQQATITSHSATNGGAGSQLLYAPAWPLSCSLGSCCRCSTAAHSTSHAFTNLMRIIQGSTPAWPLSCTAGSGCRCSTAAAAGSTCASTSPMQIVAPAWPLCCRIGSNCHFGTAAHSTPHARTNLMRIIQQSTPVWLLFCTVGSGCHCSTAAHNTAQALTHPTTCKSQKRTCLASVLLTGQQLSL